MRAPVVSIALSLTFALLALAPSARADEPPWRTLFDEGVALLNDGKYTEACLKLEASLRGHAGIGTRGKLAECYEKSGRFVSAWTAYREVAQLSAGSGDATRERVANERAHALEPKLSSLTITVPSQHDIPGLVVRRNGIEIDRARFGVAEPLDAGRVEIEVVASGMKPVHAQVAVTAGAESRFEVPRLEPDAAVRADAPPAAEKTSWQKPAGLVTGGLGLVLIGAGAYFGLSAGSTYDEAFDGGGCDRNTLECSGSGQSKIDDARTQATLSTVGFIAGGALALGGLVLYLTAPSGAATRSGSARGRGTAVRVTPTTFASGSGGGVLVGGSL